MEQHQVSMEGIMAKAADTCRLPTYEEALQLLACALALKTDRYKAWAESGGALPYDIDELAKESRAWLDFYAHMPFNSLYNEKFVGELAGEIRRLDAHPIIEICAGDGKLSYHLRKRGIEVTATDDYSWELSKEELVERLSHQEALKRCNPALVVASWLPHGTYRTIVHDVLNYPSTNFFIDIEDFSGSFQREIPEGWEAACLGNVERYSISAGHFKERNFHSCVSLLKRTKTL